MALIIFKYCKISLFFLFFFLNFGVSVTHPTQPNRWSPNPQTPEVHDPKWCLCKGRLQPTVAKACATLLQARLQALFLRELNSELIRNFVSVIRPAWQAMISEWDDLRRPGHPWCQNRTLHLSVLDWNLKVPSVFIFSTPSSGRTHWILWRISDNVLIVWGFSNLSAWNAAL
jgi:hypothetical protein